MSRPRRWPLLAALACLGWTDPHASDHEEGQEAARTIWGGEHSGLYEDNLAAAGLSDRAYTLEVFSVGGTTDDGFTSLMMPETWAGTGARVEREIDLSMWANLPDISYSLAGWAMGNERCPLDDSTVAIDPERCFLFTGWMGALNSTHFPPQSAAAYHWYHDLAVATAGRCTALDADLAALEASLPDGLDPETQALADRAREECQVEAMAYEGVGHHYLQDTWSSGHTWQRWGSPVPEDWVPIAELTSLDPMWAALVVGGLSGAIHGHQSFSGLADPMCAPHEDVVYVGGEECPVADGNMVGDYYVDEMGVQQAEGVRACTQGGVDEVLTALGDAEVLGMSAAGDGVSPTEAACFSHRASDLAWYTGLVETWFLNGIEEALVLRIMGRLVPVLPGEYETAVEATRRDLIRLSIIADAVSARPGAEDENTELAELRLTLDSGEVVDLTLLETLRNSGYADRIDAGLRQFDPPPAVLLGEEEGDEKEQQDVDAIRRTFHFGWVEHWCGVFDGDPSDPESELGALRSSCQEAGSTDEKDAACGACATHAERLLRAGNGPEDWDLTSPPLCQAFREDGGWLYASVGGGEAPRRAAAEDWCEGEQAWALTDDAIWRLAPGASVGEVADGAERVADLLGTPGGLAATGQRAFIVDDGSLAEVSSDGTVTYFGSGTCSDPRGLDVDPGAGLLFAACFEDDSVVAYDIGVSPPVLVDTLDLYTLPGGTAEEPTAVAVNPSDELSEIAVASYELLGDRDGLSLISYDETGFGLSSRVDEIYDVYEYSGGSVSRIEGLFYSATPGLAWLDAVTLVSTNFSNLACPGGSSSSCGRLPGYFVTTTDAIEQQPVANLAVDGRTSAAAAVGDDLVIVADYNFGDLYVVAADDTSSPKHAISVGLDRPHSLALAPTAERLLVGFDDAGSTCGLGLADLSADSLFSWTFDGLDETLGCVRYVAVP